MKNFLSHMKPATSSMVAILFGLFIFVPVMASPSGTPPTSNVNANFNSVTTGIINNPSGNTSGVNINSTEGLFVMDPVSGVGFQVLPTGDFYSITNNTTSTKLGNVNTTVTNSSNANFTAPFNITSTAGGSNHSVFNVDQNGNVQNPSGSITFSKGLTATGSGTIAGVTATSSAASGTAVSGVASGAGSKGGIFAGTSYGIYSSSNGTAGYFGNINGSTSVNLATPTSGIDVFGKSNFTGDMSIAGNLGISGNVTSKGFGRIYTSSGISTNIPANTYAFGGIAYCSNANHRAISCSFSASSNVLLADSTVGSTSCSVYVKNVDTVARAVIPKVTCIDPAGSPW